MQTLICIVISGNYLRYIPLSVPFSMSPYVGNKMLAHHLKVMISNSNNFFCFAHIIYNKVKILNSSVT